MPNLNKRDTSMSITQMFRNNTQVNRVSRFNLDVSPVEAASQSELPLMVLKRHASGFHNGGSIEFGPDGFLYIALGEGIRTKTYVSQAETLRQGVLRIDVDQIGGEKSHPISRQPGNGETLNYFIPNDNPFLEMEGILEEYWAIGLRNPFRISFDQKTHMLWLGDVGTTKWEEVNVIKRGGHYQYPFIEGYEATDTKRPDHVLGKEYSPLYTYVHTAYDRAVIGGIVYRGHQLPQLQDQYIFGDNYSSKLFAMPAEDRRVEDVTLLAKADQFAQRGISSITQASNGDILVTTLGRSKLPTGQEFCVWLKDRKLVNPKRLSITKMPKHHQFHLRKPFRFLSPIVRVAMVPKVEVMDQTLNFWE